MVLDAGLAFDAGLVFDAGFALDAGLALVAAFVLETGLAFAEAGLALVALAGLTLVLEAGFLGSPITAFMIDKRHQILLEKGSWPI